MNLPVLLKRIVFYSAMIFGIYNLSTLSYDIYQLSLKEDEKKNQIVKLESEKSRLNEKLVYISSSDFVEKEARTKLSMKKENEQVFVVSSGNLLDSSSQSNKDEEKQKSNFDKWMEVIF